MAFRGEKPIFEAITATESLNAGTVAALIQNTSNTASSFARLRIEVAGASAADPFIVFGVSTTEEFSVGIDNSDSDKFVISNNATPGTNNSIEIDASQNVNIAAHNGSTVGLQLGGTVIKRTADEINSVTYSAKSGDYTILDTDEIQHIGMTTGGTDRTVTLPTAADNTDRVITVKKVDSGSGKLTLDGEGAETIDGNTTFDCVLQYDFVKVVSDGTEWHVLDYAATSTWTTFTPSSTWSTNSTHTASWRRVGQSIEVVGKVETSGAPDTATLEVDIPSGLTVDTTHLYMPSGDVTVGNVGFASALEAGVAGFKCVVAYVDTNTLRLRYESVTGSTVRNTANVTQAAPFTFGSGDAVAYTYSLPIS